MKTILTAISFLIGALLFGAEKEVDPFAYVPPKEADRKKDHGSADFISDDILKALNEVRLDKGTGKGGSGIIRITILRSFHKPLVLTWFPATEEQQPSIQIKRARIQTDQNGNRTYLGLDIDKQIELRRGQDKNLKTLFEGVHFDGLSQEDWQQPGNDGSVWIYERVAESGYTLIVRNNPINPELALKYFQITRERLLQESNLTTFAVMVWSLSTIDDESIY